MGSTTFRNKVLGKEIMMGYRAQVEELAFVKNGDIFIVKEQKR